MKHIYFFTFLFTIVLSSITPLVSAQPLSGCIDFGELAVGTVFDIPNELIYTEDGIPVSAVSYSDNNGNEVFQSITVENVSGDPNNVDAGLVHQLSATTYHFNEHPDYNVLNELCIDLIPEGIFSGVNVGINGQQAYFTNVLDIVNNNTFDVEAELAGSDPMSGSVTICLTGEIETFTIGGADIGADALCYVYEEITTCQFNDVAIEINCLDGVPATFNLDFIPIGTTNAFFDLFINGDFYNFLSFEGLPYHLDFPGANIPAGEVIVFTICENDNTTCCYEQEVEVPNCNTNCNISDFGVEYFCIGTDSMYLYLDFSHVGNTNQFFDLFLDDEFYGFYQYESLPLEIGVPGNLTFGEELVITVCDNDNPDCCGEYAFEVPQCYTEGCIAMENYTDQLAAAWAAGWPFEQTYYTEQGVSFTMLPAFEDGVPISDDGNMFRFSSNGSPNNPFTTASGIFFGHDQSTTLIDVENYVGEVTDINLDVYFDGGPQQVYNIAMNGSDVFEFYIGPDSPSVQTFTFPGGMQVEITLDPDNFHLATMHFTGNYINTIQVGGFSMWMDNLCIISEACELSNLVVDQQVCQFSNFYQGIFIGMDYSEAVSDSFHLVGNGNNYGVFAYSDLPFSPSLNLQTYGQIGDTLEFIAIDYLNDMCLAETVMVIDSCENVCDDFIATYQFGGCYSTSEFLMQVIFALPPAGQTMVLVGEESGQTRVATYDDPSGIIVNWPTGVFETINIYDELSGCSTAIQFGVSENECVECEIYDVTITPTECDPNGGFGLEIDFEYNHPSGEFMVAILDQIYGPYGLDDFPAIIGYEFAPPGTAIDLPISIIETNDYCVYNTSFSHECPLPCSFTGLEAGHFCEGTQQHVGVSFFTASEDLSYEIFIDDESYGSVSGGGVLTYTFGVFTDLPNPFEVAVLEEQSNCWMSYIVEYEECDPDCANFAAEIGEVYCVSEDTAAVEIYLTIPPDNSIITITDQFTGQVNYGYFTENPLVVEWPAPAAESGWLVSTESGCQDYIGFPGISTNCGECYINDLSASVVECAFGQFYVEVNFFTNFTESAFLFQIGNQTFISDYSDNMVFGPFVSNDIPVVIDVIVSDETGNCEAATQLENPTNCGGDCVFVEFHSEAFCDGDSPYVWVTYDVNTFGVSTPFSVYINGDLVGTFVDNSISHTFGPFPNLTEVYTVTVASEFGNCEISESFDWGGCDPFCEVYDLVVESYCDNGLLFVDLEYTTNSASNEFSIYFNDIFVGASDGVNPSLTFGPFDELPNPFYVWVSHNGSNACVISDWYEYEPCDNVCEVYDLVVEPYCDNGLAFIDLEYTTNSPGNEFDIYIDDVLVGTADGLNPSLTFGPFDNLSNPFHVWVSHNGSNACAIDGWYDYLPCGDECVIDNISIEGTPCDINGNYTVLVNFESSFEGSFLITNEATGETIQASLDDLPAAFGPMNFGEIQTSVFYISAINAGCAVEELYVHDCIPSDECNFSNVYAEAHVCDGDQFLVDIEFDNGFGGPLGFYIFGDGMIFGPYQYGQTFYTFGPLNSTQSLHTVLILDIADPSCFANYEFEYICSDDCLIQEVVATPLPCEDNVFYVELDVEAANHGEEFSVVGNGNNYGTFNYNDLPITLGPFEGDNETVYEFGVTDLANVNCSNWTVVEPVNCAPCSISGLTYEVTCFEDYYMLALDFDVENPESDLFSLQIGEEEVEWFNYNDLPLNLTMFFEWNGETIRVEDVENELCGETIPFEMNCCYIDTSPNTLYITDCQDDGNFFLVVDEPFGSNLTENLVITYAPAGSTIIETVTVPYAELPVELGPLEGDGETAYFVILSDAENDCSTEHTIDPVTCDNSSCVEFEELSGIFGPATNYNSGDPIGSENGVVFSYLLHSTVDCDGNVFGISGNTLDFGDGQVVSPQCAGVGFNFANAGDFNSLSIDFYQPDLSISVGANGNADIELSSISSFPTIIAPNVQLDVIYANNAQTEGVLIVTGNIEGLQLFASGTAAFDNLCMDIETTAPETYCLELPLSNDFIVLAENNSDDGLIYEEGDFVLHSEQFQTEGGDFIYGSINTQPVGLGCSESNVNLRTEGRNIRFSFPETGNNGTITFNYYSGAAVNFQINDGTIAYYDLIDNIEEYAAPGLSIDVTPWPNSTYGTATISGDLSSFTIGGINFCMWDLCVEEDENVWPGDTDSDNLAHHFDLLNVGLAYDFTGPERPSTNNEWAALASEGWMFDFANGLNYKHADANGDGIVNAADRDVIQQNYGLTHGPVVDFEPLPHTDTDPPVYLDLSETDELPDGAVFEIPLNVGTEDLPVEDIYGIAFTVVLDPEVIDLSSIELVYPTSWLGEPTVNALTMDRIDENGRLEIAMTRTDHNNVSGHGTIVFIRGIIDDIAGLVEVDLEVEKIKAINHEEELLTFQPGSGTILITKDESPFDREMLRSSFKTFPNPTSGMIYFTNAYHYAPETVVIYNGQGQVIRRMNKPGMSLSLDDLPGSVYFLEIHLNGHIFTERIVKLER